MPDAIYKIPPDSPSYPVTQVTVYESTPTTVVYSYPPSYSTGVYVAYGVPWYGTGWYYPPYIYVPYYYPYWGASYGHGYWYSPMTGAYGSRSVWYGPYGGYSYSQGYNPNTGRYGYVETGWDGDTGRATARSTTRAPASPAKRRAATTPTTTPQRVATVQGPNGNAIGMERKVDFDKQTDDHEPQDVERRLSRRDTRTGDGNGNTT